MAAVSNKQTQPIAQGGSNPEPSPEVRAVKAYSTPEGVRQIAQTPTPMGDAASTAEGMSLPAVDAPGSDEELVLRPLDRGQVRGVGINDCDVFLALLLPSRDKRHVALESSHTAQAILGIDLAAEGPIHQPRLDDIAELGRCRINQPSVNSKTVPASQGACLIRSHALRPVLADGGPQRPTRYHADNNRHEDDADQLRLIHAIPLLSDVIDDAHGDCHDSRAAA